MSLIVQCRSCGHQHPVVDTAVGPTILCTKCKSTIEIYTPEERLPPGASNTLRVTPAPSTRPVPVHQTPADLLPPGAIPKPRPIEPAHANLQETVTDLLPPGGVPGAKKPPALPAGRKSSSSFAPVAKPTAAPVEAAPMAYPVAEPVAAVALGHAGSPNPKLGDVRADAVEELLDEQEREDRDLFRGVRRWSRNPPSMREVSEFFSKHKLLIAIGALSLFGIADSLSRDKGLHALLIGAVGTALTMAGLKAEIAIGAFYQTLAWCFLVVLAAFPFLTRYEAEITDLGKQLTQNPPRPAAPPSVPVAASAAPLPTVAADPSPEPEEPRSAVLERHGILLDDRPVRARPKATPRPEPEMTVTASPPAPVEANVTNVTLPDTPRPPSESEPAAAVISSPAPQPLGTLPLAPAAYRQKAEQAFADSDTSTALNYLYAEALSDSASDVWNYLRWNRVLNRPLLAIRVGVGLELNDLAAQAANVQIGASMAGKALHDSQVELKNLFLKHAAPLGEQATGELRKFYDEGHFGDLELVRAPKERALRGATYLPADTPAELMRAARASQVDCVLIFSVRASGTATRPTFNTTLRVVELAGGAELFPLPGKPKLGAPKALDGALRTIRERMQLEAIPETLSAETVAARLKSLSSKKIANPLALMAELRYYQRAQKLPADTLQELATNLLGAADAEAILADDDAARQQLVARWLPRSN